MLKIMTQKQLDRYVDKVQQAERSRAIAKLHVESQKEGKPPTFKYLVHFEAERMVKPDSEATISIDRMFEYTDIQRALAAVESLVENNRISLPARDASASLARDADLQNTGIKYEGYFEFNPSGPLIFKGVWITTEEVS